MPENLRTSGHFIRRVFIAAAIVAGLAILLYLLSSLTQTLLVIFAGILLAVLLYGLAQWTSHRLHLSHGLSLAIVIIAILAALTGVSLFAGPRIANEGERLVTQIPVAVEQIRNSVAETSWGERLLKEVPPLADILPFGSKQIMSVPKAFTSFFGLLANVVIILFIAIYLAAGPQTYINSLLHLLPQKRRPRAREVASTAYEVLQRFFIGRFASMAIVGVLTGLGYWIAGIPLAFVLGLIAAILEFVPYIGPLIAVVPALLLALATSPTKALYVLIVYAIVQAAESYLITPLIERKAVSIPPAALISIQLVMGAIFGIIGIFLATPVAVIVIVAIQMLYVRDVLNDDITVLGH